MTDRTTKPGHTTYANFATTAIHGGYNPDESTNKEITVPISLSTTFKRQSITEAAKFDYIRHGNANRDYLEKNLAALEGARYSRIFSSGMAAINAVTTCFLEPGDHIIHTEGVYVGTFLYFKKLTSKGAIEFQSIDTSDTKNVADAMRPNTKMVWLESPSNPLLKVSDIEEICKLVKRRNEKTVVVVDNTFLSPYFLRPLDLCADMSLHAVTKYINGHADVLMGCIATNDASIAEQLTNYQSSVGAIPSPFDCYLVTRSIKTLHLRMDRHMYNALKIAQYLQNHPQISKVNYPELLDHPQHLIHKKQSKGSSGVMSIQLKGDLKYTKSFLTNLKVFMLAQSFGGSESLAIHPMSMTHYKLTQNDRDKLGITDNLVRFNIGLENVEDLITDLASALQKCRCEE